MTPIILSVIAVLGVLFFITAVAAMVWAARTGQFQKLEEGAKVIFDKDEPMGQQTDFFPPSRSLKKASKHV